MDKRNRVKWEKVKGRGLLDSVFSWSVEDVLNEDLYKDQVEKIPNSFNSTAHYMKAFIPPLRVETHADLLSSTESLAEAPTCRILRVRTSKDYKPPKDLFYEISVEETRDGYVPWIGDLIALTNVQLKCIDDLRKTQQSYNVAFVHAVKGGNRLTPSILSSKPIVDEEGLKKGTLFAVHLMNLTTNLRIWRSLNLELEGRNLNVIKKVLQNNFNDGGNCSICSSSKNSDAASARIRDILQSFNLNSSQEAAVLSCIDTARCCHHYSVKLVKGPPGTGKTKTASCLLYSLLRMKCRTLACAPTNIAVLEVAARVVSTVADVVGYETYGMGDIILFGNRERMKVDGDQNDLLHVFLDHRADILEKSFDPSTGWKHSLASLISLLEDSEAQYHLYLQDNMGKEGLLTCERFVWKRFNSSGKELKFCIVNLYTHLPTTLISLEVMRIMTRALDLMTSLETLLLSLSAEDEQRKLQNRIKLRNEKRECLNTLRLLSQKFQVPKFADKNAIEKFCISNACLLFCTVSSSARLHSIRMAPLHCLVIDEAAQLKECESTIPLQLSGLHHAILIGDERQLPAIVNSKISEKAGFGRSLFERLVKLGCNSHLLNIQYRMHPSISLFPNKEFYGSQVLDAQNVKETGYRRRFLQGDMFESYSFINIAHGKEEFVEKQSFKNTVEAAAAADIVGRLFKDINGTGKKISIGIISPYLAQVHAIQEKIGKFISDSDSAFSVSVGTVDGFQGEEEDLIIISTVRSNENGSVGFVSNPQRANVALTRARFCLWILGNEATLVKSGSIWKKIVNDAKHRRCFYDAEEDESLAQAITESLIEQGRLDVLLQTHSPLFRNARWMVFFSDDFRRSAARVGNVRICKEVLSLLARLSNGWRQHQSRKKRSQRVHNGISSPLIEQYNVSGQLNMIWTVDILQENSFCIQVLKVWDILPSSDIPKLAQRLDTLFRNYTEEQMNRCLYKCMEGNLVVPMRWAVDSCSDRQGSGGEADAVQLPKSLASICLEDEPSATGKAARKQWRLRRN
ncbi:hypothetical protein NC651_010664 [Populus alba x Populus x berolinensis]|nr:hypothetical protein NC651_010664 [Populus alba x Populus x berolinensis]